MSEQHTWANPTSASLYAQAVGVFGLGALLAGLVPAVESVLMIPWFCGISLVLIIVSIIQFRNNELYGATVNLLIGAIFFGSANWMSLLIKFVGLPLGAPVLGILNTAHITTFVEGYFNVPLIIFIAILGYLGGRVSWLISAMIWFITVAVLALTVWNFLGQPGIQPGIDGLIINFWANAGGWMLLATGVLNLYVGTAVFLYHLTGKLPLPIGKPIFK
ncbi:MAG: hypothetical protein WB588_01330 [Dehalococcoidia bacterium]